MGGHGGLNILPQKRWNVYNRDNRLKVAQDEAKAKKQEDDARERHDQAERGHRHQQLLKRTAEGDGEPSNAAVVADEPAALQHINFWKEEETKLQHPENEKQQRDELKRRGNPDFFTSDAKFDERFALAYGLVGDKPWYAQAQKPEPAPRTAAGGAAALPAGTPPKKPATATELLQQPREQQLQLQNKGHPGSGSSGSDRSGGATTTSSSSDSSSSDDSGSSSSESDDGSDGRHERGRKRRRPGSPAGGRRHRHSSSSSKHHRAAKRRKRRDASPSTDSDSGKDRKTRRRDSSKSKSKSRSRSKRKKGDSSRRAPTAAASKSIEQLRAERLVREKDERIKQRGMLVSANVLQAAPPEKDYNGAFGFAAALKRKRVQ